VELLAVAEVSTLPTVLVPGVAGGMIMVVEL